MSVIPKCTNCGADVSITSVQQEITTCNYCGSSVLILQANKLSFFDEYKLNLLKNNRTILETSLKINDVEEILESSGEILKLIPDDFSATYYQRFGKAQKGDDRLLNSFYLNPNEFPSTEEERLQVIQHILEYGLLSHRKGIEVFITVSAGSESFYYLNLLDSRFTHRIRQEELYDDIPRDVFISYRSTDQDVATKVVNVLEQDGLQCWISSRNLRPNDNINYWDSIERAIEQCEVFLVVSSQEAMLSRDVKREISFAQSLNKKRIEIKTDNAPSTTFFKVFFDGLKWLDASKGFGFDLYPSLLTRVHELLNDQQGQDKLTITLIKLDELISAGDFSKAQSILDGVIDQESTDTRLLWRQLLIDFQTKSRDQLSQDDDFFISPLYTQIESDLSERNHQELVKFEELYSENFITIDKGTITGLKRMNVRLLRVPDYVEEIGKHVFQGLPNLTRIHLNKIKVVHEGAFASCENLEMVELGNECIEIEDKAFSDCASVASIDLPDTLISLGKSAFQGCSNLTNVKLSKRLKKLDDYSFSGTSLEEIHLPDALIEMGNAVFSDTNITKLHLPISLNKVSSKAFIDMYGLSEISSNSSQFTVQNNVLYNQEQSVLILYPPNKKGFRYEIPQGVRRIESFSFYLNSHLIDLTIPNTVVEIGNSAFEMAQQLDVISLPDSVQTLESNCFSNLRNLTRIKLSSNLERLDGEGHFSYNPKLMEVQIPFNVKRISDYCFYQSSSLEQVDLPDGLEEIGTYSFSGTIIKNIQIPDRISEIPSRAFLSCRNLRTINLSGVQRVGEFAFKDNVSLTNVIFGSRLQSIEREAFANCSMLNQVEILNSNCIIADDAFIGSKVKL
jgi:DNA-directed RNA polymerase subunit RPC12/RpoP